MQEAHKHYSLTDAPLSLATAAVNLNLPDPAFVLRCGAVTASAVLRPGRTAAWSYSAVLRPDGSARDFQAGGEATEPSLLYRTACSSALHANAIGWTHERLARVLALHAVPLPSGAAAAAQGAERALLLDASAGALIGPVDLASRTVAVSALPDLPLPGDPALRAVCGPVDPITGQPIVAWYDPAADAFAAPSGAFAGWTVRRADALLPYARRGNGLLLVGDLPARPGGGAPLVPAFPDALEPFVRVAKTNGSVYLYPPDVQVLTQTASGAAATQRVPCADLDAFLASPPANLGAWNIGDLVLYLACRSFTRFYPFEISNRGGITLGVAQQLTATLDGILCRGESRSQAVRSFGQVNGVHALVTTGDAATSPLVTAPRVELSFATNATVTLYAVGTVPSTVTLLALPFRLELVNA